MKIIKHTDNIIFLSFLLILIGIMISTPASAFAGGTGTVEDPYQIATVEQLQNVSNNLSENFVLINDIDASDTINLNDGSGLEPIGNSSNRFTGTFNGNGYVITGLYINRPTAGCIGLFGFTGVGSEIIDVGLEDVNITGHQDVGGLVGYNKGSVNQSYSTGNVTADYIEVGGLVGLNDGSVVQSYSTCDVTDIISSGYNCRAGGLVGLNYGSVSLSYSTGNVTANNYYSGGLIGDNRGSVDKSYSTGIVTGYSCVGGLVGYSVTGYINQSYSTGNVTGSSDLGGLVGKNDATINQSYSTGYVDGYNRAGGLVGSNSGSVIASHWDTETSGKETSSIEGAIGSTTAEMKDQSTYVDWDFTSTWALCDDAASP